MNHKKMLQKDSRFISVAPIIQLIQLIGFVFVVVVTLLLFIQCSEEALYPMRHVYVCICPRIFLVWILTLFSAIFIEY